MLRTCVRSSRLSLYARTQRLTENAPYKGLWLVVKTTTNQLHSVKCRKAALTSSYPIPQNGNQGGMAVIRPSICLLPFWEQAKSVGQFGQLKKPDELTGGDSQIFACQLARCRSAEDAVLCPSDMMLCDISYWVLSGAKRRQIQQLRCCVLPGTQGSAGHERIRYPSVGYRVGQISQGHADHRHPLAGEAAEAGSSAER